MKLIPRAKPVRIRISSGGKEHSTLQSLLESFRIDDVRPLLCNGVMLKWLKQIGECRLYDKVQSIGEKCSDADLISIFFDSPDKLVEYAENAWDYSNQSALDCLKKAADNGSAAALYRLGCVYHFPHIAGVDTDIAKAEECFKAAAELNHPLARLAYGFIMCEKSQYSKAFELLNNTLDKLSDIDCRTKEDRQVMAKANYALAEIYWDGKRIAPQSSAKAIDLFCKSAEWGYIRAYTRLGKIYMGARETYKALEYLEKAREMQDIEGIYQLGLLYAETGKPDMDSAKMFHMTAVAGYGDGMVKYGERLYLGKGVRKDIPQAIMWFERAYDRDAPGAAYYLGLWYSDAIGKQPNIEKAEQYFSKELETRDSPYYALALKARDNIKKHKGKNQDSDKANLKHSEEGDIKGFTDSIKQYARMSERDLYTIAARYRVLPSMAKSIAEKIILVLS